MELGSKNYVKGLVMLTLIIFFIVIFASAIFASFLAGNPSHSIEKIYGPSFDISGWINISFDDESMGSFFNASFNGESEGSISLGDLLELNPEYKYDCIPLNCGKDYSDSNPETSKSFTLNEGDSEIIGLVFTGNVLSIDSISFEVESSAGPLCESQLKIDILDNGKINLLNNKTSTDVCTNLKSYGCFDDSMNTEDYILSPGKTYCQRINLSESPGFKIGAWVKNVSGSSLVNVSLYNIHNTKKGSCSLSSITSTSGQEYSCDIDYLVTESEDYYVCISALDGDGDYRIRGNTNPTSFCGFPSSPIGKETASYQIFAQGKQFASFGSLNVSNKLPDGSTLSEMIYDYLAQRYKTYMGRIDCSGVCVVPIKFISSTNQIVTLKNLKVNYQKSAGSVVGEHFYNLTESPPRISSDFQRLFLNKAEFSMPSDLGNYTFSLKLNNQEIFSEDIEVKDVPIIKSLSPPSPIAAFFPTEFEVEVEDQTNVTNYNWDFGDDTTETTPMNIAVHIYSAIGTYNLKITVTDTRGLSSSRIFEINVSSPKDMINNTLNKMNTNLQNLKTDIQNQALFHQTSLNSVLRIENISSELKRLGQEFSAATNDSEYMIIVGDLLKIKVPKNVFKTKQADSFSFFPEKSSIDMDIVQSIGGGEYDSKRIENYRNAVIAWQQENVNLTMDFNEFSGEYGEDDSYIDSLVNIFEIRIDEKKDIVHDYYLIIPKLQNIGFDRSTEEKDGFVYVNLKGVSGVNFYTTEDIDFSDVPAFIAPPINQLVVSETIILSEESKKQRMIIFILSMISLVVMGIIAYVIIYQWYKRKYEKYLFKNRNDLYNIVTYVNNAKKKGLNNKKIIQNLKKAGWGSEQMRYIMRKYEGKRTGMVKLPLTRLINKVKKENSHQKHEKK